MRYHDDDRSLGIAAAQNKLSVGYGARNGAHGSVVAKCAGALQEFICDLREMRSAAACCANWACQRNWDRNGVDV